MLKFFSRAILSAVFIYGFCGAWADAKTENLKGSKVQTNLPDTLDQIITALRMVGAAKAPSHQDLARSLGVRVKSKTERPAIVRQEDPHQTYFTSSPLFEGIVHFPAPGGGEPRFPGGSLRLNAKMNQPIAEFYLRLVKALGPDRTAEIPSRAEFTLPAGVLIYFPHRTKNESVNEPKGFATFELGLTSVPRSF